jgi:hypothetical protein
MTPPAAQEAEPQRQIIRPQLAQQPLCFTGFPRRLRLRQIVVFRVGARLGKIKRKELENASPAVGGSVLRFTITFFQYVEEIRPDSANEVVVELQENFSDTTNFVHRHV